MRSGDRAQPRPEIVTGRTSVFDQSLAVDHLENREAGRRRYRITAECREESRSLPERLEQRGPRDHDTERVAVGYRFAESDQIRKDPTALETPEVRATPTEAALNLVRDDQCACCAHRFANGPHARGRRVEDARAGQHAVDQEGRRSEAPRPQSLEGEMYRR